jgi:hypothetical protein
MFVELCRNRECEGKHCQRLAAECQSEGRSRVVSKDMICVVGRCCSDGIASAKFVKETFRNNVFPVSLDTIEYHGVTKPPTSIKRQPGRPRTKRIHHRSKFLDPEDSPVTCSKCGKRGHNRRTC